MSEKKSVDDILSSIKNTVEKTAAVESESDVLELSGAEEGAADAEAMPLDASSEDELIDLNAFAAEGGVDVAPTEAEPVVEAVEVTEIIEMTEVKMSVESAAVDDGEDDIDIDSLMAEVAAEDEGGEAAAAEAPVAEAEEAPAEEEGDVDIDALMAAEAAPAEAAEEAVEEVEPEETAAEAPVAPVAEKAAQTAPEKVKHLSAIPGPNGLQVSFPVEVLAEALRPLVASWVEQNLPDIAERLIREELSKLAEK